MNSELLLYVGIGALVLFALLFFIFRKKSRRQVSSYLDSRSERAYATPRQQRDDDNDIDFDIDEAAEDLADAVGRRSPSRSDAVPGRSRRDANDDTIGSTVLMQSALANSGPRTRHDDDAPATANGYDHGHREVSPPPVNHSSHDTGYSGGGDSGGGGDGGGGGGD